MTGTETRPNGAAGEASPAPGKTSAVLRVLFGPGRGKRFELQGREFVLGNGEGADVRLEDATIAGRHALLTVEGAGGKIRSTAPGYPFRVNGRIVEEEAVLGEGAQIEIGGVVMSFSLKAPVKAPSLPTQAEIPRPAVHLSAHERQPISDVRDADADGSTRELPYQALENAESRIEEREGDFQTKIYTRRAGVTWVRTMSRAVSWIVVLLVLCGGSWVGMDLYQDVLKAPPIPANMVRQADVCKGRNAEARVLETRRIDQISEYQAVLPQDRDMARKNFDSAMELYWSGDVQAAVDRLASLSETYPDFVPPFGGTLSDIQDRFSKRIMYKGQISRAYAAATDSTTNRAALQDVLAGLKGIPRNDSDYGPVADLVIRELERKLDGVPATDDAQELDGEEPALEPPPEPQEAEPAEAAPQSAPSPEAAPASVGAAATRPAQVVATDAAQQFRETRARARELYETADFEGAARVLFELAQTYRHVDQGVYTKARYLYRKMRIFDQSLTEGMRLMSADPLSKDGLLLLEQALAADHVLFRFYGKIIRKQVAQSYAARAAQLAETGRHKDARNALDAARRKYRNLEAYAAVEKVLLSQSEKLFEEAQSCLETDRIKAWDLLSDVVAAAPAESRVFKKAVALMDEMVSNPRQGTRGEKAE